MKLKEIVKNFKWDLRVYKLLIKDRRVSKRSKWLLGLALAYLAMPFDLIPDFIPIIGHLDDLIIIPGLIYLGSL